jgi:hypothetical protein
MASLAGSEVPSSRIEPFCTEDQPVPDGGGGGWFFEAVEEKGCFLVAEQGAAAAWSKILTTGVPRLPAFSRSPPRRSLRRSCRACGRAVVPWEPGSMLTLGEDEEVQALANRGW